MRPGCGSTLTTICGITPARRQAPSAPSTATTSPSKPDASSRSRLRRRWRLGPAATTTAASPSPTASRNSRIERPMRARLAWALARPAAATRSKVAPSSWAAIRFPSSILALARPHERFFAHEANATAQARECLLLELVGRVGLALRRLLDDHLQRVVSFQELLHVVPSSVAAERLGLGELQPAQLLVHRTCRHQLGVAADRLHPPALQHDDAVGVHDGREPVCDDDGR